MFADRTEAGKAVASALLRELPARDWTRAVVLGLPRGGVVVAAEVADRLGASLDVILVRKLGVPWHPELAFGAIAEGGFRVLDDEVLRLTRLDERAIAAVESAEWAELDRRARLYRGDRPPVDLTDRPAIVVDDGLATGSTARVACLAARARGARSVTVAVPVGPPDAVSRLAKVADSVVCVLTPLEFTGVGAWYEDFSPPDDATVRRLLDSRRRPPDAH
ncbi:MAG: phosphoribosyltransferase [Acidothermus sp.]|nr:phosphoribosyltransferase [Acidothermus sp.]